MKKLKILLFITLFLMTNSAVFAANHYIRAGATGNNDGSDWTNAWTDFPKYGDYIKIIRGDTYFVADGSYSGWSTRSDFIDSTAGSTQNVTIKKATVSDHGTNTGWSDIYGYDKANILNTVKINDSYIILDGVTGSGKTGHGFKITTTDIYSDSKLILIGNGADYIRISHVEMQHAGMYNTYNQACLYILASPSNYSSYNTFSYNYMHDVNGCHVYWGYVNETVFEHNYLEYRNTNSNVHGEAMSINSSGDSANNTIRFNIFKDISGTGYIVIKDSIQGLFHIYGNLFFSTNPSVYTGGNGAICNTTNDTNNNMYVYNNTFYNIFDATGNKLFFVSWSGNGTGNIAKNNLIYGCGPARISGVQDYDYNASDNLIDSSFTAPHNVNLIFNPFSNSYADNFSLRAAFASGINLNSPYNVDMMGRIKGDDGYWDIGAYEFEGAPEPPPIINAVTISPNSGYAKIGTKIYISAYAENNQPGLIVSNALINGKSIPLADSGNGAYRGTYTISEWDHDGINVEATNITLTGIGGTSARASSSGSTLKIDANKPIIKSVTISPDSGWLKNGDSVIITVSAYNDETGLTPSNAIINSKSVPLFDEGNGKYIGTYIAQIEDPEGTKLNATDITLTDAAGNVSLPAKSSGSTLMVDLNKPSIESITLYPNTGWLNTGDTVTILVSAKNREKGLIPSNALINGKSIVLEDKSDGTYMGTYLIEPADSQGVNIEATGVTLTDLAGNVSDPASSIDSSLMIDMLAPEISSVLLSSSSNNNLVTAGDSIKITVFEKNNESGLIPSDAIINGNIIKIYDSGDGTYSGYYIINSEDNLGAVEATDITLKDKAGNICMPAGSIDSGITIVKGTNHFKSDFNKDNIIDFNDLVMFGDHYEMEFNDDGWDSAFDLVPNGKIDFLDFTVFSDAYGRNLNFAKIDLNTYYDFPVSKRFLDLNLITDKVESLYKIEISVSDFNSIKGIEFILSFDENSAEFLVSGMEGIPSLNIKTIENGLARIAVYTGQEKFDGKIFMNFKAMNNQQSSIFEMKSALIADDSGITKIDLIKRNSAIFASFSENNSGFELFQNKPNPFNPSTSIPFYIYEPGNVKIDIYNTEGQKVDTLINSYLHPGKYDTVWNPDGLSSGIYFYRINLKNRHETRKMLLIK